MKNIATLTMNPTVDVAYEVDRVEPTHKLRCQNEKYDPGGGGLNVARVFGRLGGEARCYYLAGGPTGETLNGLLYQRCFERKPIQISGNTRICFNVYERETGREYRFVPQGPTVAEEEWRTTLAILARDEGHYLVASGSLPPGVPSDFYRYVSEIAQERGIRMVLDTSGAALREGLGSGGIHLVKPSLEELADMVGQPLEGAARVSAAAMEIVEQGKAEMVAVTMGEDGGVFADANGPRFTPAQQVTVKSAVGAGDSFLAAMVHGLASGREPFDAFQYGMAAGSAAVLTQGTDMCRPEDVERLYAQAMAAIVATD